MQPSVIQYYDKRFLNNVNGDIGRALFADDGTIWKSRLNIACVTYRKSWEKSKKKKSSGLSEDMGSLLEL